MANQWWILKWGGWGGGGGGGGKVGKFYSLKKKVGVIVPFVHPFPPSPLGSAIANSTMELLGGEAVYLSVFLPLPWQPGGIGYMGTLDPKSVQGFFFLWNHVYHNKPFQSD